jgi:8-amino-7-oxononanoate synthase
MRFADAVQDALSRLEEQGLLRAPRVIEAGHGPELILDGRHVLDLCSNNYLGLARDPDIAAAPVAAVHGVGLGAAASRQISGTGAWHRLAETRLATFVEQPAALLFGSGYAANAGAISALVDEHSIVLSDRLNHASLIDGCRLSRARVHVYEHLDCGHVERLLRSHRAEGRSALLITESLFSMDGDVAPLEDLRALCDRYEVGLYVDEAHALGVLGPQGRGLCAAAGIRADVLLGTLGKAFGTSGAFVAGAAASVRLIENRARSFVFSTASPEALAAAAVAAVDRVARADDRRAVLAAHAIRLREGLDALGYRIAPGASSIIPVHVGEPNATMELSAALLDAGVFVHGIRPPTVAPGSSRLRVTPIATHSEAQITATLAAFATVQSPR